MYYVIAVVAFLLGVWVGMVLKKSFPPVSKEDSRKEAGKKKLVSLLEEKGRLFNNDVQQILGVSDATATRYLDELEKEGKIRQVGAVGHAVYYEKINGSLK